MKTKSVFLSLSFLFCCITTFLNAQQPTFTRVFYDASGTAQGYSVAKAFNQDYVIAGERDNRALVMKIDQEGNILWSKRIGSFDGSRFNSVTATHDSYIVMAGSTPDTVNWGNDIFCVKMSATGDTIWTRALDVGESAVAYSVQETSDHGLVLAGHTSQNVLPYDEIVVVKLDSSGHLAWSKLLSPVNGANYAYSIKQTTDGGFIIAGEMDTFSPYITSACLVKLTSSGDISWTRKITAGAMDYFSGLDVVETSTGFLYLMSSNASGVVILKTDFSGNFLSGQVYSVYTGGGFNDPPRPKLQPTSDGGYIFSTSGWGMDPMIKIDSTGNLQWAKTLAFISAGIVESYDSGYLALGNGPIMGVIMAPTDHPQIGLIKTDASGNGLDCVWQSSVGVMPYSASLTTVPATSYTGGALAWSHPVVTGTALSIFDGCVAVTGSVAEKKSDAGAFQVSPNPSKGSFQVTLRHPGRQPMLNLEIYNVMGENVFQSSSPIADRLTVDLNSQPDGVYYVQGLIGGKLSTLKLVICHEGK